MSKIMTVVFGLVKNINCIYRLHHLFLGEMFYKPDASTRAI